jgi:hypothetical protein
MKNVFLELIHKLQFFYIFNFKRENNKSTLYDNLIKITLQTSVIPRAEGYYFLSPSVKEFVVDARDLNTFQKLFYVTPPKKGQLYGTNRTIGNGEVALYWLFKYQSFRNQVNSSKEIASCDLLIEDNKIEVKDYKNPCSKLGYGRFASDKRSLKVLNIIFGLYMLFSIVDLNQLDDKVVNVTNFSGKDLLAAFQKLSKINKDDIHNSFVLEKFNILNAYLGFPTTPTEYTRRFLIKLIKNKLEKKPGNQNYVVNVNENGLVTVFYVDFCRLESISDDNLISGVEVGQSTIYLNLNKLFG